MKKQMAVLKIEMPTNCYDCPLYRLDNQFDMQYRCSITDRHMGGKCDKERDINCPLEPLSE